MKIRIYKNSPLATFVSILGGIFGIFFVIYGMTNLVGHSVVAGIIHAVIGGASYFLL